MFHFFFFTQKTAYDMRISDWSSDVCSSDLSIAASRDPRRFRPASPASAVSRNIPGFPAHSRPAARSWSCSPEKGCRPPYGRSAAPRKRSEEHTSELQSLMRISYAVFCLKKKTQKLRHTKHSRNNKRKETQ